MKRAELLASISLIAGASAAGASPQVSSETLLSGLLGFRYVVGLAPYRVGILTNAGVAMIGEQGSSRTTLINLPRPKPGVEGWHAASPPPTPYFTEERRSSDVVMDAGPDKLTAAAPVGPHAIFGMAPPPDKLPRAYLVRVTPSTLELQTRWLPVGFDGYPIAFFIKAGKLGVVDLSGNVVEFDYP